MEVLIDLAIEAIEVDVLGNAEDILVLLEKASIARISIGILSEVHIVHSSQIVLKDGAIISEKVEVGCGLNKVGGTLT